jgi:arylsulfatase A-like enzyme
MTIRGSRPSIALVHCHDLGDWLSCYGHRDVPSPRFDDWAQRAVVFDAAFATAPLCTPARSSLFTGRSPHVNGLMGLAHHGWRYHDGVQTLPQLLAAAGYRTALLGLQHEDLDARTLGFGDVQGMGFLPRALEVARLTERWLAGRSDADPFFAAIGLWEAHRPWPDEDYEPADPGSVQVPPYLPDNAHTRDDLAHFYGSIRQLDEAIDRIVAALRGAPGGEETLIIFTTDHGAAFPRAKSTLYDSGVKVAFLVSAPASWGVAPGRRSQIVSHLDVVPTLLELAGLPRPEELEGESLLGPLLEEDAAGQDRVLYLEKTYHDRYDPIRAVRTRSAKYIRNLVDGPLLPLAADLELSETRRGMGEAHLEPRPEEELYLLGQDPWELRNVVTDPVNRPLRDELRALLDAHLVASDDPVLHGPVPAPPVPDRTRSAPHGAGEPTRVPGAQVAPSQ